jgi:DNA-binding response OmpR family regulator
MSANACILVVVDDDVGMVETLTDILEASHFRVDAAHSGDDLAREARQTSGKPVVPKPLDMDLVLKIVSAREGQA